MESTTAATSRPTRRAHFEYVRVEYAAQGLSLLGVGSGTLVDGVQVRKTTDNCFTINGGRVDLKHLVCQYPADEMFELNAGYQGRRSSSWDSVPRRKEAATTGSSSTTRSSSRRTSPSAAPIRRIRAAGSLERYPHPLF